MVCNIARVTATGDVSTSTIWVQSVLLTAGSTTCSADLRAGGSGGTVVATLSAVANTTAVVDLHGSQFTEGLHVTLAGTGATVTVAYL